MKTKTLEPVSVNPNFFDRIEAEVNKVIRREVYLRVLQILFDYSDLPVNNADGALMDAIQFGHVYFNQGIFLGKFNAQVSRELKALGARWDRSQRGWRILKGKLPAHVRIAINASEDRWRRTTAKIDQELQKIVPEEVAGQANLGGLMDSALADVDRKITNTLPGVQVKLTEHERHSIAADYTNDLKRSIQGFTAEEVERLRARVAERALAGKRYDDLVTELEARYNLSQSRAKFIARQETNLMLAAFKKARYTSNGVDSYEWRCVAGSASSPVRPTHKVLEGKVFRWDDPPVTDLKGSRNNPGEDYGCRCFALPVVRF